MNKQKISAVSYLNTKPFIFGIQNSIVAGMVELSLDTPAECARKLIAGEVSIGLVPVSAINEIPNAKIISGFGIGARGEVGSVLLVSECPVEQVNEILLDYQSRTSVELLRILVEKYWKLKVRFIPASEGYETKIHGTTAALIIGDRALLNRHRYNFIFDLGMEWHKFTGLPFVFACWVCNREIPAGFLSHFEDALAYGCSAIDDMLTKDPGITAYYGDASNYLKKQIIYLLDEEMKKGLTLFLSMQQVKAPDQLLNF